jgi:uncharacterized protein YndB with AHSA1/START domain
VLMKILVAGVAVVVVGVIVVATRPAEFRITRTATMAAPAAAVFEQVNDFRKWEEWSPWAKLDPAARKTLEGPPTGTGAVYRWAGNHEVGEGVMTITESRPHELVRVRLQFLKPFAATSTAEFTFKPEGDRTAVTWTMTGTNSFMAKAIHLVMNMERMIGGNFEKGLASMKSLVEGG